MRAASFGPGVSGFVSRFRWHHLVLASLTIILAMMLFQFPLPPKPGIDSSWSMVLVYAHRQHLQFGPDIAFTFGPYGFLVTKFYYDGVPVDKILWESFGKLALTATLIAIGASNFGWIRFGCFYLGLLLAAKIAPETVIFLANLLLPLFWLIPRRTKPWQIALALIWMAFLAQVRFNYAVQGIIAIGCASLSLLIQRDWKKPIAISGAFVAAFVSFWLIAGQSIGNLPAYLASSWEITRGYFAAMAVDHAPMSTWCNVALLWLLIGGFVISLLGCTDPAVDKWLLFYFCCAWFFIWKYGFTRADVGHIGLFFPMAFVFCTAAPGCFHLRHRWLFFDVAPALCLLGLWSFDSRFLADVPHEVAHHLHAGPGQIFRPKRQAERFAAAEREAWKTSPPPDLQPIVGPETIDVINFNQYEVLISHLNYRPRPVFQSYTAYTAALLESNLHFYQSASAPQFVLARLQSIDQRYPAQDDSLLLEDLPRHYAIAKEEKDYLLLRRKTMAPVPQLSRTLFWRRHVLFGQEIELPESGNHPIEMRAIFKPSLYGSLRALLVQPAEVNLVLTDRENKQHVGRVIPEMASAGFLVQPLLESQADFGDFMKEGARRLTRSIRFETISRTEKCWSKIEVEFSQLPELRLQSSPEN